MGLLGDANQEQDLILWRKWVKQNKEKAKTPQLISSISLSNSEEWIMIKTTEALALLNAESAIGKELWQNLQKFGGQGLALVIYPASGKLGFDIDFDEAKKVWYSWDEDVLTITAKQGKKKASLTSKITWEKARSSPISGVTSTENSSNSPMEKESPATSPSHGVVTKAIASKSKKKSGKDSLPDIGQKPISPPTNTTPPSVLSDLNSPEPTNGVGLLEQPWEEE